MKNRPGLGHFLKTVLRRQKANVNTNFHQRLAALIRGKTVPQATAQLMFCQLKGGRYLLKTLDSVIRFSDLLLSGRRFKCLEGYFWKKEAKNGS